MEQPLFVQPDVEFEKNAGEVDLPEDPNQWPQEVLQELYKQVPYVHDFEPQVTMERVDSERGYGLGQIELASQTEAQMGADPEMMEAAGLRAVRIPVVIREHKLSPFDLMVNDAGNVVPLTESRMRQALFRPQAFDVTSQTPGDQSMIAQLYPPYRQNHGMGGGGVAMGDTTKQSSVLEEFLVKELEARDPGFRKIQVKTASTKPVVAFKKTASIIGDLIQTFNKEDVDGFFQKLSSDHGLQAAYSHNKASTLGPLGVLANYEPLTQEKRASAMSFVLKPTVVQLVKVADGYQMKTASVHYWAPNSVAVTRGDVVRAFGEKVALAADEAGQVTMAEGADAAPEAAEEGELDSSGPEVVTNPGLYKVQEEETGKELIGFVVPNLLDIDGTALPLAMFTNGSQASVQPSVLGAPAGEGATLPVGPVKGAGAFFSYTDSGELQATIPLELSGGSYVSPGEPSTYVGETFDGRPVEVSVQPNIQAIMQSPEGKMLVPAHWQWTPLGEADTVALASSEVMEESPEDWHESAPEGVPEDMEDNIPDEEPQEEKQSHVWVRGDHDCFTFVGPAVEKLAAKDLSLDDAMFLLAGLGVELGYGTTKLAHSFNGPQKIVTGRRIKTASEQDVVARSRANVLHKMANVLRRDLTKEASVIPDPTAVDTVLSLGFINPENVMNFVSYLPTIEESQMKLCDLLLGARVGMDLPTTALEHAVRTTEEVIEGLKILAFQS